jgi:GT2 family glycosyltransferase
MNTQLTIVIVNYNTKDKVLDCIQSITASKNLVFKPRIVVVDNNSSDESSAALTKRTDIIFIPSQINLGFSKGNNLAIPYILGDYVWFLNPDTTVDPDTIATMLEFMDRHPEAGIATPKLVLPDGSFDKNCHRGMPTLWNSFCHFSGLDRLFPRSSFFSGYYLGHLSEQDLSEVEVVGGSSLLTRVSIAKEIGWWDEDYFMYGEDIEFAYQVRQRGYKIYYVPNVIVHHHHGASSGLKKTSADVSTRKRSVLATTNAMRIFYNKHYQSQNPQIINFLVNFAISLLEQLRLISMKA